MSKIIKTYFVGFSLLAHLVLGVLFITLLSERITNHWRWEGIKRAVVGNVDKSPVYVMDFDGYLSLPKNQWLKIHQQTPNDAVHFYKQPYSGSAFDNHRAHLLMFGGNTNQNEFSNAIYTFDMNKLQWHASYSPDSVATYSVNEKGFPVAGLQNNHPWAINTCGGIEYDSLFDSLVIASSPQQLSPSKAATGKNLASIWSSIKQQPTWNYSFIEKQWKASESKGADFYAYTMSYDSDRDVMTGFTANSIFNWTRNAGWKQVAHSNINQWSINSVYDSVNHAFVIYGGNARKNDVYVYVSGESSTKKMPTIGERPPAAGSEIPLAFHSRIKKTVAVINTGDIAQTWLYDLEKDRWEKFPADFPFNVGTNYAMEYDAVHNLIVFIANPTHEETSVWVLKI
jgi:hypothetical protein